MQKTLWLPLSLTIAGALVARQQQTGVQGC